MQGISTADGDRSSWDDLPALIRKLFAGEKPVIVVGTKSGNALCLVSIGSGDAVTQRVVSDIEIGEFEKANNCTVYTISCKALVTESRESYVSIVAPLLNAICACAL